MAIKQRPLVATILAAEARQKNPAMRMAEVMAYADKKDLNAWLQEASGDVSAEYGDMVYSWSGYVDRAETALDEQTRTIDVVVRIPRPMAGGTPAGDEMAGDENEGASSMREAPPLLVGQFVEVQIDGAAPERYFAIPRAGLRTGNEVWALRGGNLVTIIPVRVLQRADEVVYVTGGLEAGQEVVVTGIQIATEGMAVRTGVE